MAELEQRLASAGVEVGQRLPERARADAATLAHLSGTTAVLRAAGREPDRPPGPRRQCAGGAGA
ncbi:MAG: hypothetical protein MZW92_20400 [Comamonadaceae bacterium]|nr:hypothetical protein [Comamonadaceae bacterium]